MLYRVGYEVKEEGIWKRKEITVSAISTEDAKRIAEARHKYYYNWFGKYVPPIKNIYTERI